MQKRKIQPILWILALIVLAGIVLALPPVWSRVSFHAQQIYAEIKYKLNPPEQIVFTPGQAAHTRIYHCNTFHNANGYPSPIHPCTEFHSHSHPYSAAAFCFSQGRQGRTSGLEQLWTCHFIDVPLLLALGGDSIGYCPGGQTK
jgi:hypothetical protein